MNDRVSGSAPKPPPLPARTKLIDRKTTFWAAVILVGPFALPLLWRHPQYSRTAKVVITLGVLALTWVLSAGLVHQVNQLLENIRALRELR